MKGSIPVNRDPGIVRISRRGLASGVLSVTQHLPLSPREAFSFFEDPLNLPLITPPWLKFRIIGSPERKVFAGAEFDYTIRWFGFTIPWRSRITEYRPGFSFTDEQLRGPYRSWVHRHLFRRSGSGTDLTDLVNYALPLAALPVGGLIERQLRDIFTYRGRYVARLVSESSASGAGVTPALPG